MSSTQDVLELGRVILSLNYASVMVTSCWVYDYLLTFSDEITFLTQSQWTWAKLLYIVCRYFTHIFLALVVLVALQPTMSVDMCRVIYSINTYLGTSIVICAEGVFLIRVCAIWGFRRRMMVFFLLTGVIYAVAGIIVTTNKRAMPIITKSPVLATNCFDNGDITTVIVLYVILAMAEIQIWCFTVYKAAVDYWREGTRNRLLEQLIHHNVIYMSCGLVFSFVVILMIALLEESNGFMIVKFVRIWQVVVHAFLVTKMYRGLWRAERRRVSLESFTFGLTTFHATLPEVSTQP